MRQSNWEGQCDPQLLKAQLTGGDVGHQWLPLAALACFWFIVIVALAGPAWERLPQPVYNNSQGRALVFDLSLSMNSTDLAPSRLVRARYKLADLVEDAEDKQQALIVFAGDAFLVSPFTDDSDTLINLIPSLNTDTIPVQGSRADLGLNLAQSLIENSGLARVEVILITDGITQNTEEIAASLASDQHWVSVLAIGTDQGAPIPLANGGLLKNAQGDIIIPGVDHGALQQLASEGNGVYQKFTTDDRDIRTFNRTKSNPDFKRLNSTIEQSVLTGDAWIDRGVWLLIPVLLIGALSFRRGWILVMVLMIQSFSEPVIAFEWQDLWSRADQQAALALKNNVPENVPSTANPEWRGAAAYRQQNHQLAAQNFAILDTPTSHYNEGNALAKSGAFKEAINAYQQALAQDPKMSDAIFNKQLIEKLLEEQQLNQDQQPDDESNSKENQNSEDAENSTDQSQQQEKKSNRNNSADSSQDQNMSTNKTTDGSQKQNTEQPKSEQESTESLAENSAEETFKEQSESASDAGSAPMTENKQALEQWLKQVPDDPGGLLRRKFNYQYSQRASKPRQLQSW